MPQNAPTPADVPSGRRARRLRRRFLAAFGGPTEEAAAAWSRLQMAPTVRSADDEEDRRSLYHRGVDPAAAQQVVNRRAARDAQDRRAQLALAAATTASSRVRRTTTAVLAAALLLVAAGATVLATRPAPLPDATITSVAVPLLGSSNEQATLVLSVARGGRDTTALVTRTVYRRLPLLARANRAAGNEATFDGSASMSLDPLESVTGPRHVTVILLCTRAMSYSWSLETRATSDRTRHAPIARSAHGRARCGAALSAATASLPATRLPTAVRVTAPAGVRYLLSVQVTA